MLHESEVIELQEYITYNSKIFSKVLYLKSLNTKKYQKNYNNLVSSLKEEKDERIEQALQDVMRGEPWYTD